MMMTKDRYRVLSRTCFGLGFASILGSIVIWFAMGGLDTESRAHAERFGLFVGLWAPTLIALSNRFALFARPAEETVPGANRQAA